MNSTKIVLCFCLSLSPPLRPALHLCVNRLESPSLQEQRVPATQRLVRQWSADSPQEQTWLVRSAHLGLRLQCEQPTTERSRGHAGERDHTDQQSLQLEQPAELGREHCEHQRHLAARAVLQQQQLVVRTGQRDAVESALELEHLRRSAPATEHQRDRTSQQLGEQQQAESELAALSSEP